MHGPIKVKGPLWPTAVLLCIPPPPEGEEIVPASSHLVPSPVCLFIQALDLSHAVGHWPAAGLTHLPHRYHYLLSWAVRKAGDDGGGSSSHGVHLTGRNLRCMWISEPDIRGARAGNFHMMGAHDTQWNPLLRGLSWCILLTNLTASRIFCHIQDGKGCSSPKYRSICFIKEERLKGFVMEDRSLTCFWWDRRHFLHKEKLNGSVCVQNELEERYKNAENFSNVFSSLEDKCTVCPCCLRLLVQPCWWTVVREMYKHYFTKCKYQENEVICFLFVLCKRVTFFVAL